MFAISDEKDAVADTSGNVRRIVCPITGTAIASAMPAINVRKVRDVIQEKENEYACIDGDTFGRFL